jgi:Metal-dependent amidase/aminoacylase/carboxypeptidase
VLTFGTIEGGKARNIICDEVTLHGTLRCADNDLRAYMKNRIREIAQGVSEAFGAKIDVNIVEGLLRPHQRCR